jgi:hypothetical protein
LSSDLPAELFFEVSSVFTLVFDFSKKLGPFGTLWGRECLNCDGFLED